MRAFIDKTAERERNCSSGCINCLSWITDSMSFPTALLLLTGSNLSQQIIVNKVSYKETIVFCQEITTNNKHCRSHNKWSRDGESMSMNGDWTVSSTVNCVTVSGVHYREWRELQWTRCYNSEQWFLGVRVTIRLIPDCGVQRADGSLIWGRVAGYPRLSQAVTVYHRLSQAHPFLAGNCLSVQ